MENVLPRKPLPVLFQGEVEGMFDNLGAQFRTCSGASDSGELIESSGISVFHEAAEQF